MNNLADWNIGAARIWHTPCTTTDLHDNRFPWVSYLSGPVWRCPECKISVPDEILFTAKLMGIDAYTIEQPNEQSS